MLNKFKPRPPLRVKQSLTPTAYAKISRKNCRPCGLLRMSSPQISENYCGGAINQSNNQSIKQSINQLIIQTIRILVTGLDVVLRVEESMVNLGVIVGSPHRVGIEDIPVVTPPKHILELLNKQIFNLLPHPPHPELVLKI